MAILLIETTTTAGAEQIVAAVEDGELWGVDMGTTSSASCYSKYALVDLTSTRAHKVTSAAPDEVFVNLQINSPSSFTDSTSDQKTWYLRGKLG